MKATKAVGKSKGKSTKAAARVVAKKPGVRAMATAARSTAPRKAKAAAKPPVARKEPGPAKVPGLVEKYRQPGAPWWKAYL